jgi:hypothetical protein
VRKRGTQKLCCVVDFPSHAPNLQIIAALVQQPLLQIVLIQRTIMTSSRCGTYSVYSNASTIPRFGCGGCRLGSGPQLGSCRFVRTAAMLIR